jgi:hypothetical protein
MRTHGWFGLLGLCAALLASPAVAVAAGPDAFVVPGTPTALQAGQPRLGEPVWLTPIWALSSAGVTRRAWSGARHTWAFPDTEDPAAAFDDGEGQVVVLDRASASVSAFKATPGAQTLRRVRRNAVGQDPVAMTAVDLRDGDADGYAVADRGSNDVSVLKPTGSGQGAKFGLTRVAVGAQPDAIASGAIDSDSHADLAVDDSGSDAVSLLFGDGKGGFPTRIDISLPAAPTALAVTNPTSRTLLSGTPAVVVATADGSVWFIGAGRRPQARRVISGLGDPIAVVALALNYDRNLDLAVIDRAAGTLDVLYGTGPGRFAAPVIAWHGRDPVAVTGGSFGADALDDLAVADAATATVTLVLTPGDQRLAPPEPTLALANYQGNLVARDGWLAWVRAVVAKRYELVVRSPEGTVTRLSYRSWRPFAPLLGESRAGRRVVAFPLCRPRCRVYAYDLASGHARALPWRAPKGCIIEGASVWRTISAVEYASPSEGHCKGGDVWVRNGRRRPRRLGNVAELRDLRGHTVLWQADLADAVSLRLWNARGGRARVVYTAPTARALALYSAKLDGRDVLWLDTTHGVVAFRQHGRTRQCWTGGVPSTADGADSLLPALPSIDFAVDRGQTYYADLFGVFSVAPARVHWTRDCQP